MTPISSSATAPAASLVACTLARPDPSTALFHAGEALLPLLGRGDAIDARVLREAMEAACGGSDAQGHWAWKDAYEACEVAQVLFLRRFGAAMRARAGTPAAQLAMLAKLAALLPTHTRRSQESQALQQFSTPIDLGFVASVAAGITPDDLVSSSRPGRDYSPSSPSSPARSSPSMTSRRPAPTCSGDSFRKPRSRGRTPSRSTTTSTRPFVRTWSS